MHVFTFVRVLSFVATLGLTFAWLTPRPYLNGEQMTYKPLRAEGKTSYHNPNGEIVDLVLAVDSSAQKVMGGVSWQIQVENRSPMAVRFALGPLNNKGRIFDKNEYWDGWLTLKPLEKLLLERGEMGGEVEVVGVEIKHQDTAGNTYILGRASIYQPKVK